jgi:CubicO group peptidase (beta-lactamase class C family)
LPRIAVDLPSLARTLSLDPYRGTTAEDVFRSVSRVPSVSPRPGDSVAYSNLGYALLGRLLERRAGRPYEELLRERVLVPLGLQSIATAHEESAPIELAVGHGPGGRPTPYWHVDGYAPAGCLIASADQLLDYVAIQLAPASHPGLAEAQRLRVSFPDHKGVGLGWMHAEIGGHRTIWHNGATGGFRSFVGFLPDEGRGFVVLANGQGDLDALARRLLDPAEPPLPGRDANVWTAIAITLALLAWGPLALADTLRRARSVQRPAANEEAAKPPPGIGRLDVARSPLSPAIALVLAERLGAWPELPFAAWWLALAASVVVFAALARRARDLPWWRGGAKRALGLASMTALEVVVLAFLFS